MNAPLVQIILAAAAAFALIGGIGILRMPDVYNRIHSLTVCVVGGSILIMFGVTLSEGLTPFGLRALLIALLLYLTNAIGSHAIARAAHRSGIQVGAGSLKDDLREKEK